MCALCILGNYCTRWHPCVKGLSLDGGRADFSIKTAATLPLIKIYGMILIWAGSISLDSSFKLEFKFKELVWKWLLTRNRFCESDVRYLHSFKIHFLCSISASSNRLEFLGVTDEAVLTTVPLQNLKKYPFKEITVPYPTGFYKKSYLVPWPNQEEGVEEA